MHVVLRSLLKRLSDGSETLVNIALVVTCLWVMHTVYALPSKSERAQPTSYKTGERLELDYLDNLDESATPTLLLFVRSTCKFCTESMPFYSVLTRDLRSRAIAKRVRVVVITSDDERTASEYLMAHSVAADTIVPNRIPPQKVWATPTVIVSSRGIVKKEWIGRLDVNGEKEVREALGL